MNLIYQITEELNTLIQEKELEIFDVIKDAPPVMLLLENGFAKLKETVSDYMFPSKRDEVDFFKEIKPKLFSKLIFLRKTYQLELNMPVSSYETLRRYFEKELEQINHFCNKNAAFIQYYRSGKTALDEFYFLRGRREMELNLESFYFERDPKFSTHFDFKAARLLANDMLAAYLNCKLVEIKAKMENVNNHDAHSKERWTAKKADLVELIYAIHAAESVNAGDVELKVLGAIFEKSFNVDLGDVYRTFLEIRSRKGERTIYLKRLIDTLNKRMDDADSK